MQVEISIALDFITQFLYNNLPRRCVCVCNTNKKNVHFCSFFSSYSRVNMFREQMFEYLRLKYQDNWYIASPKDSEYRSIYISSDKVDEIIVQSANDVALDLQEVLDNLPSEITIWIDPGEVYYRIGNEGFGKNLRLNNLIKYMSSFFTAEILYKNANDELLPYTIDCELSPVLSIERFARTRFGSLKTKYRNKILI